LYSPRQKGVAHYSDTLCPCILIGDGHVIDCCELAISIGWDLDDPRADIQECVVDDGDVLILRECTYSTLVDTIATLNRCKADEIRAIYGVVRNEGRSRGILKVHSSVVAILNVVIGDDDILSTSNTYSPVFIIDDSVVGDVNIARHIESIEGLTCDLTTKHCLINSNRIFPVIKEQVVVYGDVLGRSLNHYPDTLALEKVAISDDHPISGAP
jgi:hypothetical protein